jgi:hypothetical protein
VQPAGLPAPADITETVNCHNYSYLSIFVNTVVASATHLLTRLYGDDRGRSAFVARQESLQILADSSGRRSRSLRPARDVAQGKQLGGRLRY